MTPSSRAASMVLAAAALLSESAVGHELRPLYVTLDNANGVVRFALRFRPIEVNQPAPRLELPASCVPVAAPARTRDGSFVLEQGAFACAHGISGERVTIRGLCAELSDAVIRMSGFGPDVATETVRRADPTFLVPSSIATGWRAASHFLVLGLQHIAQGVDHLAFVVLLLALAFRGLGSAGLGVRAAVPRALTTLTAFTAAHSLALGLSVWKRLTLPLPVVEALIAFTLVALALELATSRHEGATSLTALHPHGTAFVFGLVHGLGFASALSELSLSKAALFQALAAFNVGVELGQLLFVAICLVAAAALRRSRWDLVPRAQRACILGIGALSSAAFVSRALDVAFPAHS